MSVCRESFSDFDEGNLAFWRWGAQESMEFFSPFLPFLEVKESCCMVRVAGQEIAGTGGDPNSQGSTGRGLQLVSPIPAQLIWAFSIRSRKFHVHTSFYLNCGKLDKSEVFVIPVQRWKLSKWAAKNMSWPSQVLYESLQQNISVLVDLRCVCQPPPSGLSTQMCKMTHVQEFCWIPGWNAATEELEPCSCWTAHC